MSYVEPKKETTSGVNFIKQHRHMFSKLVSNASVVGIVGVRIRPTDNHIWDPLAKTSAKLIYCLGKESGQEFDEWKKQNRPGNQDITLYGYFDDCFDQLCEQLNIV